MIILVLAPMILAGCTQKQDQNNLNLGQNNNGGTGPIVSVNVGSGSGQVTVNNGYKMAEIANHNTASSCWMAIDGKVYDVTDFVSNHPGGATILAGCGLDASQMFAVQHNQKARDMLPGYILGELVQ